MLEAKRTALISYTRTKDNVIFLHVIVHTCMHKCSICGNRHIRTLSRSLPALLSLFRSIPAHTNLMGLMFHLFVPQLGRRLSNSISILDESVLFLTCTFVCGRSYMNMLDI